MNFNARKAAKSALWVFPFSLLMLSLGDLAFNRFQLDELDWRQWIAKAVALAAVLSVLFSRRSA